MADTLGAIDIPIRETGAEEARQHAGLLDRTLGSLSFRVIALNQGLELAKRTYQALAAPMHAVVDAANLQQRADRLLEQSLRSTGQYSVTYMQQLKAQAKALQDVTTVGDETTESIQRGLAAYDASPAIMKRATEATLDLAAALGTDTQAAVLLGRAFAGQFSTLSRYGIFVDQNATKAQKLEQTLAQIERRFGGQARAEAETYHGRIQQLSNAWGDLKEEIGYVIVDSDTLQNDIRGLTTWVGGLADDVHAWVDANRDLINQKLDSVFNAVAGEVKSLVMRTPQLAKDFGTIAGAMVEIGSAAAGTLPKISTVADKLQEVADFLERHPTVAQMLTGATIGGYVGGKIPIPGASGALALGGAIAAPIAGPAYRFGQGLAEYAQPTSDYQRRQMEALYGTANYRFHYYSAHGENPATLFGAPMTGMYGQSVDVSGIYTLSTGEHAGALSHRAMEELKGDYDALTKKQDMLGKLQDTQSKTALDAATYQAKLLQDQGASADRQIAAAAAVDAAQRGSLTDQIAMLKQRGDLEARLAAAGDTASRDALKQTQAEIAQRQAQLQQLDGVRQARLRLAQEDARAQQAEATAAQITVQRDQQRLDVAAALGRPLSEQVNIAEQLQRATEAQLQRQIDVRRALIDQRQLYGLSAVDVKMLENEIGGLNVQLEKTRDTADAIRNQFLQTPADHLAQALVPINTAGGPHPLTTAETARAQLEVTRSIFGDERTRRQQFLDQLKELDKARPNLPDGYFSKAREKAIDDFLQIGDAGNAMFDKLAQASQGWGTQFTDELANIVETGKVSFSDLALSFLKDIDRILIQSTITDPLLGYAKRGFAEVTGQIPAPDKSADVAADAFTKAGLRTEKAWFGVIGDVGSGFQAIILGLAHGVDGVLQMLTAGGSGSPLSTALGAIFGAVGGYFGGGGSNYFAETSVPLQETALSAHRGAFIRVMHAGGRLSPGEVMAILQEGELVVPRDATRQIMQAMREPARMRRYHEGGIVTKDGPAAPPGSVAASGQGGGGNTFHFPLQLVVTSLDSKNAAAVLMENEKLITAMYTRAVERGTSVARTVGRRR